MRFLSDRHSLVRIYNDLRTSECRRWTIPGFPCRGTRGSTSNRGFIRDSTQPPARPTAEFGPAAGQIASRTCAPRFLAGRGLNPFRRSPKIPACRRLSLSPLSFRCARGESCTECGHSYVLSIVAAFLGCDQGSVARPPKTSPARETLPTPTVGCSHRPIQSEPFGETKEGVPITRYILANDQGMTVSIIDYGATVTSIELPDREKKTANVVLGISRRSRDISARIRTSAASCGRYANRIAKGKFKLNGKSYTLAINDGPNHMHGGLKSFSDAVWSSRPSSASADGKSAGVELMYESRDGEEGYPGTVKTTVVYTLTDANELRIDYRAVSDKPTIINLTSHIYWNLRGAGTRERLRPHVDVERGQVPPG